MSNERFYVSIFGRVNGGWTDWLNWSRDVAEQLGHPFTFGTCLVEGKDSGKATRYSYSRLERRIRQEPVKAVDLAFVPEVFKQLAFDWQILSMREAQIGRVFLGCDTEFCDLNWLVEITTGLLNHIDPIYGFGDRVAKSAGSAFTSIGIGTNWRPNDSENRAALERWDCAVRLTREFEQGLFRSIYPLNILSPVHLDQLIDGTRLRDAIQAGRLPGELSIATANVSTWQLRDADLCLVRDALARNNLLI